MRSLKSIEDNIKGIESQLQKTCRYDASEIKDFAEWLAKLRLCRMYLETEPTEDAIKRQKEDVERKIQGLDKDYDVWLKGRLPSKMLWVTFTKLKGLKKLQEQQSLLDFLLQSD